MRCCGSTWPRAVPLTSLPPPMRCCGSTWPRAVPLTSLPPPTPHPKHPTHKRTSVQTSLSLSLPPTDPPTPHADARHYRRLHYACAEIEADRGRWGEVASLARQAAAAASEAPAPSSYGEAGGVGEIELAACCLGARASCVQHREAEAFESAHRVRYPGFGRVDEWVGGKGGRKGGGDFLVVVWCV
jgi:hypothetical protein